MDVQSQPFLALLDANAWVAERLLQTTVGTALLLAITRSNAAIALPEVVELEVNHVLGAHAEQAVAAIEKGARLLRQLSGRKATHQVPTQEAIKKGIEARWVALAGVMHRVPFTHDHARAALSRVIAKVPPCGENNEQFRDACIWEVALQLAKDRPVFLITNDGAFFEGRDRTRGALARSLQVEAEATGNGIRIFSTVGRFLEAIAPEAHQLDEAEMKMIVLEAIKDTAERLVAENTRTFHVVKSSLPQIRGYATPEPSAIAISFEGRFDLERIGTASRGEAKTAQLKMVGTCAYDPSTQVAAEIEVEEWAVSTKETNEYRQWYRPEAFERDFMTNSRLIE